MKIAPTIEVPITGLSEADRNPNRMSEQRYAALRKSIEAKGFLQGILVRRVGLGADEPESSSEWHWEIVDGHHRVRAAIELGYEGDLPAQDVTGFTDEEVEAVRLSMGNRGELDLTVASEIIDDLVAAGWTADDLEITGFDHDELVALAGATQDPPEEELLQDAIKMEEARLDEVPDVFVLEVAFESADELKKARSLLRRAGGKGNKDLAKGFRTLAGWDKK